MPSSVSPVYIANLALSRVHVRQPIVALTDNSREARVCNLHYTQAVEDSLEEGDFGWARRRALLSAATLTTYPNGVNQSATVKGPWAYGYRLPSDVLIPLEIDDQLQTRGRDMKIPFSIELLDGIEVLYTDQPNAILLYTARITDTTLFSRKFASLVAWKLAKEIAGPITGKTALADRAEQKAMLALDDAIAHDYQRDTEPEVPDPSWIRARGSALTRPYLNE